MYSFVCPSAFCVPFALAPTYTNSLVAVIPSAVAAPTTRYDFAFSTAALALARISSPDSFSSPADAAADVVVAPADAVLVVVGWAEPEQPATVAVTAAAVIAARQTRMRTFASGPPWHGGRDGNCRRVRPMLARHRMAFKAESTARLCRATRVLRDGAPCPRGRTRAGPAGR